PIQSGHHGRLQVCHWLAICIGDRNLHFVASELPDPESKEGTFRRIVPTINTLAVKIDEARKKIKSLRVWNWEKLRGFHHDLRRQLAKWPHIIEDREATAVGCNHEIIGTRMNLKVIHPNVRQIANPNPAPSGIEGCKEPEVSARVKQALIHRIFTHH